MSTVVRYPHIEKPADGPARLERTPRVRIAQIVMDHLAHGWSAEELCRQHPYLSVAEAHAALLYYYDHLDEIDGEIRSEWEESEAARAEAMPSPFRLRMSLRGGRN